MKAAISRAFSKHPIIGNIMVYGPLYTGAEFMQQTYNKKFQKAPEVQEPYDTGTLTRYAIMGTCVFPHTLYHAYKFLDKRFVGNSTPMALRKLACDALILTPINLTLFYTGMSVMEGEEDIWKEWREKIIPTFTTASIFWVPANYLNFKVLPPGARVVFVACCTIVWVSILCWFKKQNFSKEVSEKEL